MVRQFIGASVLLILAALLAPVAALAQSVGEAVAVTPGAELRSGGRRAVLVKGAPVAMGDVVTTDATGRVQLLFQDGTKIAVGAGSRLVIEEILMQSGGTAQRFAVNAVGGTFRFITGKSAKPAYSISTPTATMGIRGTQFDFSVNGERGTNVVLFRGQVNLCTRGNCAEIRGRCTLAVSTGKGAVGGVQTRAQKDGILAGEFPFVVNQAVLSRQFQAPLGSCGDLSRVRKLALKTPLAALVPATETETRSGNRDSRPERATEAPGPAPGPEPPPGR